MHSQHSGRERAVSPGLTVPSGEVYCPASQERSHVGANELRQEYPVRCDLPHRMMKLV